jgi:mevalonate kinase
VVYGHTAIACALSDLRVFARVAVTESGYISVSVPGEGGVLSVKWPVHVCRNALRGTVLAGGASAVTVPPPVRPDALVKAELQACVLSLLADGACADFGSAAHNSVPVVMFLAVGIFACGIFCERDDERELRGLSIAVTHTTLPIGAGLGSSAALSVALAAALVDANLRLAAAAKGAAGISRDACPPSAAELELINGWAFCAEELFHGSPSGLDNSVACFGGSLAYSRVPGGGVGSLRQVERTAELRVLVVNTHQPKETARLVAGVRALRDELPALVDPVLAAVHAVALEALAAMAEDGATAGASSGAAGAATREAEAQAGSVALYMRLKRLVALNHGLLYTLGVSHPSLEHVVATAARHGLAAKLTGAGGGGCAFVLLPPIAARASDEARAGDIGAVLAAELSKSGCSCFETTIGGVGVLVGAEDCT